MSSEISPRSCARFEDPHEGLPAILRDGLEQLRELGVVGPLSGEARKDRQQRRAHERLQVALQRFLEIALEATVSDVRETGQIAEGLDDQRKLRGPAAVDRRLTHPRALRDALDGERREADLHEQLPGSPRGWPCEPPRCAGVRCCPSPRCDSSSAALPVPSRDSPCRWVRPLGPPRPPRCSVESLDHRRDAHAGPDTLGRESVASAAAP